jgi:hypothetical protein
VDDPTCNYDQHISSATLLALCLLDGFLLGIQGVGR